MTNVQLTAENLENLRFLLHEAWQSAGQMAFNQEIIERMGNDPFSEKNLETASDSLKSAWMAIEATGIMPALFSIEASENLVSQTKDRQRMHRDEYDFALEENFNAFKL